MILKIQQFSKYRIGNCYDDMSFFNTKPFIINFVRIIVYTYIKIIVVDLLMTMIYFSVYIIYIYVICCVKI